MNQSPFSSEATPRLPTPSAASGTDKSGGTVSAKPSSSQVLAENAGRVGAYSSGTHLNLKFSVADTDRIVLMARQHMTCVQIATWFWLNQRRVIKPGEVAAICKDSGVFVRWGRT